MEGISLLIRTCTHIQRWRRQGFLSEALEAENLKGMDPKEANWKSVRLKYRAYEKEK